MGGCKQTVTTTDKMDDNDKTSVKHESATVSCRKCSYGGQSCVKSKESGAENKNTRRESHVRTQCNHMKGTDYYSLLSEFDQSNKRLRQMDVDNYEPFQGLKQTPRQPPACPYKFVHRRLRRCKPPRSVIRKDVDRQRRAVVLRNLHRTHITGA